ncbi:MAG: InlB B-repeat-containing protein [Firmicutes bacterium]|nr:InlB B-repeat-containing protein [Bacillota bacterium]
MKKLFVKGLSVTLMVGISFVLSSSLVFAKDTGWVSPTEYYDNEGVQSAIYAYAQDNDGAYFDSMFTSVKYGFGEGIAPTSTATYDLVPENAIIKGIEVRIDGMKNFYLYNELQGLDESILNVEDDYENVSFDVNLCVGSDNVSSVLTLENLPDGDTDSYLYLGSTTSLWDYSSWDADKINSLGVKVRANDGGIILADSVSLAGINIGLFLDHLQVRITYSMPSYSIDYNVNGGVNDPSNPSTYEIVGDDIILGAPTRTGYTFGGWYDNTEFSGTAITTISVASEIDYTLYAKWVANPTLPQTGDFGILIGAISTISMAGAGLVVLKRKSEK